MEMVRNWDIHASLFRCLDLEVSPKESIPEFVLCDLMELGPSPITWQAAIMKGSHLAQ